jgi:hypothetical protein
VDIAQLFGETGQLAEFEARVDSSGDLDNDGVEELLVLALLEFGACNFASPDALCQLEKFKSPPPQRKAFACVPK